MKRGIGVKSGVGLKRGVAVERGIRVKCRAGGKLVVWVKLEVGVK